MVEKYLIIGGPYDGATYTDLELACNIAETTNSEIEIIQEEPNLFDNLV